MSKSLNRSKVTLRNAKNDLLYLNDDDAYLDDCCYNTQQSIEFVLKYLVELTGVSYVMSHDIRAQLNKLSKDIPYFDKLWLMAPTINSWEDNSRYKDNFVALRQDVDEAIAIAEALISYAESLSEPTTPRESSIFNSLPQR